MKTKSNIVIPKGATHVVLTQGGKSSDMDIETFSLQSLADLKDMADTLEFVKVTGKGKKSKKTILGGHTFAIVTGQEANRKEVKKEIAVADAMAGNINAPVAPDNRVANIPDELTTSVITWNNKEIQPIALRENSNVLNRFEYIPEKLQCGGAETGYSMLRCSDNGKLVGKPFAGTYGLLNNSDFIGVIESICAVLDKMGLEWTVATTGSLKDRERTFISLQLSEQAEFTIGGRVFQAFLNCLNSIPSNSGCTVTFANNTFCVCCKNTFAHVLHGRDGSKFHAAIKHTKGMRAALNDIPVLVEAYFAGNKALFANLQAFNVFPVSLVDAENYFAAFIGRDLKGNLTDKTQLKTRSANMIETLKGLFVKGRGNKGETALDLFSAVTEYYTHFSAGESDDKAKQFESSEGGDGYISKGEFYAWLVAATQDKSRWQAIAKVGDTLLVNYRNGGK